MTRLPVCACARTREYCVTQGCMRDEFKWRYSTEGRDKDRLRRIIDIRRQPVRPISRWLSPEKAIAQAWLMNMEPFRGVVSIEKVGTLDLETPGVP